MRIEAALEKMPVYVPYKEADFPEYLLNVENGTYSLQYLCSIHVDSETAKVEGTIDQIHTHWRGPPSDLSVLFSWFAPSVCYTVFPQSSSSLPYLIFLKKYMGDSSFQTVKLQVSALHKESLSLY